jgi:hypothetical protein
MPANSSRRWRAGGLLSAIVFGHWFFLKQARTKASYRLVASAK